MTAPAPSPANRSAAAAAVGAALASMDALFAAERAAEGSGLAGPTPWRGLYWADRHRFTNFQARRRQVRHVATALRGGTHDERLEEFADVLAWLATIANITGVDLEEAITRKYGAGCPGCGHFTCRCDDAEKP